MELREEYYKADIILLEKYQSYSAELLRISLLGIALLGFFFDKVSDSEAFDPGAKFSMALTLGVAAMLFAIAAAAALAHRFYSTDGIFYHIRAGRRELALQGQSESAEERDRVEHDKNRRMTFSLKLSEPKKSW